MAFQISNFVPSQPPPTSGRSAGPAQVSGQVGQRDGGTRVGAEQAIVATRERIHEGPTGADGPLTKRLIQDFLDRESIRKATEPRILDNPTAAGVRNDYRAASDKLDTEASRAAKVASSLGEGTHPLANGGSVTVTREEKTGATTVTTRNPDGSSKTVTTGPEGTRVEERDREGNQTVTSRQGTTIRVERTSACGQQSTDVYGLDSKGPHHEHRDANGVSVTYVNPDGSTDTFRNGCLKPEHEDGRFGPLPIPPQPVRQR